MRMTPQAHKAHKEFIIQGISKQVLPKWITYWYSVHEKGLWELTVTRIAHAVEKTAKK